MRFINKYLRNLAPYKVASHKIWDVSVADRKDILKLDWNEATIPPSPRVKERLQELVKQDDIYSLYPSTNNKRLMLLLADYCSLPEENIQYFASSDSLHEYLVRMYVGVGDPILILSPSYDNFRLTCESQGAQIYYHDYESDFSFDEIAFRKLIESITPSLVYICTPNNPSGNVIDKEYIVNLLHSYPDTIFLIDEAYYEFYGHSMSNFVLLHPNLFVTRTFSKAFALANFRAGYLISAAENIAQISKIRNPKNFTTFTQEAVIAVLSDVEYMQAYASEVVSTRDYFGKEIKELSIVKNVYPSQGNFLLIEFVNFDIKMNVLNTLSDHNIFVRNLMHNKLLTNTLRITIGTKVQMDRVLGVIRLVKKS
jgi:histidinol-phosphate aminotransferase